MLQDQAAPADHPETGLIPEAPSETAGGRAMAAEYQSRQTGREAAALAGSAGRRGCAIPTAL